MAGSGHCRSELLVDRTVWAPALRPLPGAHRLRAGMKAQERTPLPGSAEGARVRGKGIWGCGQQGGAVPTQHSLSIMLTDAGAQSPRDHTRSGRDLACAAALQGCPGTPGLWGPCCGAAHPSSAPRLRGGPWPLHSKSLPRPRSAKRPRRWARGLASLSPRPTLGWGWSAPCAPCLMGMTRPTQRHPRQGHATFSVVMSVSASWRFCVKMMLKTAWERLLVSFMFVAATVLGERKPQVLTTILRCQPAAPGPGRPLPRARRLPSGRCGGPPDATPARAPACHAGGCDGAFSLQKLGRAPTAVRWEGPNAADMQGP